MEYFQHDPYPSVSELVDEAEALVAKEGLTLADAKDRVTQSWLDLSWDDAWAEYGATLEGSVVTSSWSGVRFQIELPEDFPETGDVGLRDGALEMFIQPSITGVIDMHAPLDEAFRPAEIPIMVLTADRDPGNSGTFMTCYVLVSEKFAPTRRRHVVAGEVFEELVSRFFDLAPAVDAKPWQESYESLNALLDQCDDIQDQLERIRMTFGEQWAAELAYIMLTPNPWNSGAYSLAARDEKLGPEAQLDLVREGFQASLIEAEGALPPAGREDDWENVDHRQALRMMAREAEILEKMGRQGEAAAIYRDLERRIPRDNLGLHGRAKAVGRLN